MVFRRLRNRMIAHIVLIVSLVTLVSFFAVFWLHKLALNEHLETDAKTSSEIIEHFLLMFMLRNESAALEEILPELAKMHHLKSIKIVTPEGKIVFTSEPTERGKIIGDSDFFVFLKQEAHVLASHHFDGDVTHHKRWRKIYNESRCQGCHDPKQKINGVSMIETADTISFSTLKSEIYVTLGIAFGVIALLSFSTYSLFIPSVDRPVRELRKTIQRIQDGHFETRVNIQSKDELGQLAKGLNVMAAKLEDAQKKLISHHRSEIEQVESIAKIGEMAAGVAHEIKNPISGIVFAMNSIVRETNDKDPRKEIFEEVVKQANKVEQNLESLLSFARHSRLEQSPTDLNAIIERILLFIRQQPDARVIITETDLAQDLPIILIDSKQIEQVILNLVINAIQAMPEGGTLTITTMKSATSRHIRILVKDTGVGIPNDKKERIFEPFYTTKPSGIGLGLALCREIVLRHDGEIDVESKPEVGTIFSIKLPIETN